MPTRFNKLRGYNYSRRTPGYVIVPKSHSILDFLKAERAVQAFIKSLGLLETLTCSRREDSSVADTALNHHSQYMYFVTPPCVVVKLIFTCSAKGLSHLRYMTPRDTIVHGMPPPGGMTLRRSARSADPVRRDLSRACMHTIIDLRSGTWHTKTNQAGPLEGGGLFGCQQGVELLTCMLVTLNKRAIVYTMSKVQIAMMKYWMRIA